MNEIIKAYKRNIQKIIISFAGNNNVQDLEQEVYIKIWKNLSRYRENGSMWSWIKTITVNTSKDYLKSRQFSNEMKTDSDEETLNTVKDKRHTPEDMLLQQERRRLIIDAVEKLKPKLKEVIIFFDMQEMSYEEISQKLNCPVGTVKSRLFNARKQLQIELEERRIQ